MEIEIAGSAVYIYSSIKFPLRITDPPAKKTGCITGKQDHTT